MHTESLFKNSAILPLDYLIEYFSSIFYQYLNNHLPVSFNNTWQTNVTRHEDLHRHASHNELNVVVLSYCFIQL